MSTASTVSSTDRLALTLVMAAALHAIVILGVGFGVDDESEAKQEEYPAFEITLVKSQTDEEPEDASYLAQANQQGGGNTRERVRAETVAPAAAPDATPQLTVPTPPAQVMSRQSDDLRAVMTSANSNSSVAAAPTPAQKTAEETVTAAQIINSSQRIASLEVELGRTVQAHSDNPREHFITANSRASKDVAYLEAWRRKVERIGNLNYPDEAKRRHLTGGLILDVALNPDGTINDIHVTRSSGQLVLDEAAVRIVRLAAPFAPFPEDMRKEYDVFHIIRTWKFESGEGMATR